jgi:hypothetical protein
VNQLFRTKESLAGGSIQHPIYLLVVLGPNKTQQTGKGRENTKTISHNHPQKKEEKEKTYHS